MTTQRELVFQAPVTLTGDERRVLEMIRGAGGRAVTRQAIAEATGLHDREVRTIVKVLVEVHQAPIVSNYGQGGGYLWAAGSPEHLARCEKIMRGQALSLLHRVARLHGMELAEYVVLYPLKVQA
jgi:hypothetical protein